MSMQAFTDNYEDNSTEAGFQFTFYCDHCREGYKTHFRESQSHKKGSLFRGIGRAFSIGASLIGQGNLGHHVERGSDILSERFNGMTPEWQKEHDEAFMLGQNEAKGHFHRCPRCTHWVCDDDWNEQEGLCVEDAPRMNVEVAAAKAGKMVEDIREKAANTKVFHGEIESKQTLCPQCGKPVGEGKFCNHCGASLGLNECPRCGAQNASASRFCGECGNRLD
jgi:hypothetical protein